MRYHIIGLTGRNASGKGTVASFLMKLSFVYHSLSDTLRNELKNKDLEEIHSLVSSGGSFGSSTFEQHIGLGSARKIKEIQINWPNSSNVQIFKNVPINKSLLIEENKQNYYIREIKPINISN